MIARGPKDLTSATEPDDRAPAFRLHLLRNRAKLKAGPKALGRRFRYRLTPWFPRLIGEVKWLFSATDGRVLGFYLEHEAELDVLWERRVYCTGLARPWAPVATMLKVGATRAECARLLLQHYLSYLRDEEGWDRFYSVSDAGLLSAEELRALAHTLWV